METAEFYRYPAILPDGSATQVTIATGPVIIENGKVLLDKHGDDQFWKFPGGRLKLDLSSPENARKEVKEELGIDVELTSDPYVIAFDREKAGLKEFVILIHYLAKRSGEINPGSDIREWAWHEVDNLPADCAPNIKPVIEHFVSKE